MPTVTVNIAGPGAPTSNGEASLAGHMWYSLSDGKGKTESYGFSPAREYPGNPFAPGAVNAHGSDDTYYTVKKYSRTFDITQAQYDAMQRFGRNPSAGGFDTYYNGLSNSCIDFTWKALEKGGLNTSGFQGELLPLDNIDRIKKIDPVTGSLGKPSVRRQRF